MISAQGLAFGEKFISENANSEDPEIQQKVKDYTAVVERGRVERGQADRANAAREQTQQVQNERYGSDLAQAAAQGVTFGFADEIQGAGAAVGSLFNDDQTMGEAYTQTRDKVRGTNEAFRKSSPKAALAAEMGGGLLTGGLGVAKAGGAIARAGGKIGRVKGQATAGSSMVNAGRVGAVQGAAYGVGSSESDTVSGNIADAAGGALVGGVVGGALGLAGGKIAAMASTKAEKATIEILDDAVPTTQKLKDDASDFYNSINESEVSVSPGHSKVMIANLKADKDFNAAFDTRLNVKVKQIVNLLEDDIKEGKGIKFSTIEKYRRNLKAITANPSDTTEKEAAHAAARYLDEYVGTVPAKAIKGTFNDAGRSLVKLLGNTSVGKDASSAKKIAAGFTKARSNWRKHKKTELVRETWRSAAAKDNVDDAVEVGMSAIHAQIGNRYKGLFSPAEEKLLLKSTKGGVKDALGFTTKIFQGLGGSNLPGSGVLKGIGYRTSAKLTKVQTRLLEKAIRNGSDPQFVAREYIKMTPKAQRDPTKLAEILKNSSPAQLKKLEKKFKEETIQKAIRIALISGKAGGVATQQYAHEINRD